VKIQNSEKGPIHIQRHRDDNGKEEVKKRKVTKQLFWLFYGGAQTELRKGSPRQHTKKKKKKVKKTRGWVVKEKKENRPRWFRHKKNSPREGKGKENDRGSKNRKKTENQAGRQTSKKRKGGRR